MPESNVILAPAVGFDIGDTKLSHQTGDHNGWLLCSAGRTVSRTTYAALFAAVGTTYGAGDGSTTFGLPDAAGRAIGAAGNGSGLTARAIADSVGAETVGLSSGNNGPHDHPVQTYATSSGTTPRPQYTNLLNLAAGKTWNTNSSGSGTPHANIQPTFFLGNLFIYAGT